MLNTILVDGELGPVVCQAWISCCNYYHSLLVCVLTATEIHQVSTELITANHSCAQGMIQQHLRKNHETRDDVAIFIL
jgi:hypothetical protein